MITFGQCDIEFLASRCTSKIRFTKQLLIHKDNY